MSEGGDEITQPNTFSQCFPQSSSRRHSCCADAYAWWPQLPCSGWHPPTSSWGYDWRYWGGTWWWCWDTAPRSKKLADNKNRYSNVWTEASKEDYQTAAIPWSHPILCSWPFAHYDQSVVGDVVVAWLCMHNHIVNAPAAGSLANRMFINSRPVANQLLLSWNTLAGQLFKDSGFGWVFCWHFGGRTDGW